MAKPRLIILIRHAQSEGNKNREIHQTIPDHRVKLTQEGWQQAYEAGRRLRGMLRADDTLHFFTSPYRRTRETTEGILATLTADNPEPSLFKRDNIKVYEEPRLREQDFGNFQPCSAEMERMWQERADYGHFFYRIPNGESAADAYDRISGFNESLWRQFQDDDFASVCVLVTHGLMSRVFLMKWYHFSVEYFEDLRNVNHCEFLIMRKQEESGKYILENKLRTWSELRRERAQMLKDKEKEKGINGSGSSTISRDAFKLEKTASVLSPVVPRRWGGCPNGCTHDKNFKIRSALADLVRRDGTAIYSNSTPSPTTKGSGKPAVADGQPSSVSNGSVNGSGSPTNSNIAGSNNNTNGCSSPSSSSPSLSNRRSAARRFRSAEDGSAADSLAATHLDVTLAQDEIVSSPDGTPSFISVEDRLRSQLASPNNAPQPLLHVGRDFGGTYSGHTSDADSSGDEKLRNNHSARRLKLNTAIVDISQDQYPRDDDVDEPASEPNGTATDAVANGRNGNITTESVNGNKNERRCDQTGMGRRRMANRLGDTPICEHHHDSDHHSENEHEHEHENGEPAQDAGAEDSLAKAEREDKSIRGSVY